MELNEHNVLDIYMRLRGNIEISEKEKEEVKKRFFELVNGKTKLI